MTVYLVTVQSEYRVTFPAPIVKVLPAVYEVPEHSVGLAALLVVHQPTNVSPVKAIVGDPVLPRTVTVDPKAYGDAGSDGAFPLVTAVPAEVVLLYVTVYLFAVHSEYRATFAAPMVKVPAAV